MRRTRCFLLLLSSWSMPGPVLAEAFRSYATVVDVQPIVETVYTTVSREVCTDPHGGTRDFTPLASSIGEDIRRQQALWQAQRSCTTLTDKQPRERVTGYRVTYRYRGYTSTTRLAYHPGERMPVNIRLAPLP